MIHNVRVNFVAHIKPMNRTALTSLGEFVELGYIYFMFSPGSTDCSVADMQEFAQACINIVPNGVLTRTGGAPMRRLAVPPEEVLLESYDFNWAAGDPAGAELFNILAIGGVDLRRLVDSTTSVGQYLLRYGMGDWLK